MKFVLLNCASASELWSREASELYKEKIGHLISFSIQRLRLQKGSRDDRAFRLKSDSDQILNELTPDDFVVLFDERGQQFESRKFSEKIGNILNSGKKRTVFIIGGAYGVDDRIRSRAQLKVCLSSLVMNHLVAELVALEQIYRALMILKNIPYHNDWVRPNTGLQLAYKAALGKSRSCLTSIYDLFFHDP